MLPIVAAQEHCRYSVAFITIEWYFGLEFAQQKGIPTRLVAHQNGKRPALPTKKSRRRLSGVAQSPNHHSNGTSPLETIRPTDQVNSAKKKQEISIVLRHDPRPNASQMVQRSDQRLPQRPGAEPALIPPAAGGRPGGASGSHGTLPTTVGLKQAKVPARAVSNRRVWSVDRISVSPRGDRCVLGIAVLTSLSDPLASRCCDGPEHPDSGFFFRRSVAQLPERAEEHALPGIPTQKRSFSFPRKS